MRLILALLNATVFVAAASAQNGYPGAIPAQPAWGGYTLPAQIPYQPTLASDAAAQGIPSTTHGLPQGGTLISPSAPQASGQAYTLAAPVALPSQPTVTIGDQPWQTYPEAAAPYGPYGPPPLAAEPPLFPEAATSSGLRPLPKRRDAREGFFQKARFTANWIPQLDDDSLGWTDLRTEVTVGLPFFTRETPILITPSYELHFLERPLGFDLPPRLHDLAIDFSHFRRITNDCFVNFAVTPGYYADDHSFDSDDALRINGRALAIYDPTPEWKWVLGATYVHAGWTKVVPVAGFIYEPNDDASYEVVFPRPRVAWRLPNSPVPGRDEFWFYVLGEFSNLIWAFEQNDGSPDMLASRDFRLILGLERKIIGGLSHRVEIGYVFNREIKLASDGVERDLDDSVLLRAGLVY